MPLWLFLTLLLFLEVPTSWALYKMMDGHNAGTSGLLSDNLLLRVCIFTLLKAASHMGAQTVRRMRFRARLDRAKAQ